jgi:hypothetical protein
LVSEHARLDPVRQGLLMPAEVPNVWGQGPGELAGARLDRGLMALGDAVELDLADPAQLAGDD